MKNGLFKLSLGDWGRGLLVAVLSPVVVAVTIWLGAIISAAGFDVFSVDWTALSRNLVNISIIAAYGGFSGYIAKNLMTDNKGVVLGIDPK